MSEVADRAIIFADDASASGIVDFIAFSLNLSSPKMRGDHARFAIAVPGGSTPGPILTELARHPDIDWQYVTVHLTDDRCVPADHPASNFGLLQRTLGKTDAQLVQLEEGATPPAFDLVWLGMGEDGHIASLFPNTNPQPDALMPVQRLTPNPLPAEAPFDRLSLAIPALVNTRQLMLVVKGKKKRAVLDAALAGENDLPIARLLAAATCPVTIFWSET